ncbi:epoxide hydrolase family protein [Rhizobium sp. 0TCS1.26]|uniref:epoxide hydrolase family protein n=1 Tax=Rhizobium sp. 0TCS1.26 TaxID=3142623 RepID=UPI003D2750B1
MSIRPFQIHVSDEAIEDLRRRLSGARWPTSFDDGSWEAGAPRSFMRRLVDYWLAEFDWRREEAALNRLPQYMARVEGTDIHFLHQRGIGPRPMPIILTHGWPGSFTEMEKIIDLLSDPAAHGGDAEDAFDVVVPSLPGYGFSAAPAGPGTNSKRVAELWFALMRELGYSRFAAQGGDIGAGVTAWLGRLYPQALTGLHLNYIPGSYRPPLPGAEPLSQEEQDFLDRAAAWSLEEGAYAALQATKHQTLAFALTDSPIGLAAWMVEKFRSWSDCGGNLEDAIPMDAVLRDVSIYWFGGMIDASLRIYRENRLAPLSFEPGDRIEPPMAMALFPGEMPTPPRSYVERVFNVERWTHMPRGGHFAALEQPQLLAEDIRTFFRPLRN